MRIHHFFDRSLLSGPTKEQIDALRAGATKFDHAFTDLSATGSDTTPLSHQSASLIHIWGKAAEKTSAPILIEVPREPILSGTSDSIGVEATATLWTDRKKVCLPLALDPDRSEQYFAHRDDNRRELRKRAGVGESRFVLGIVVTDLQGERDALHCVHTLIQSCSPQQSDLQFLFLGDREIVESILQNTEDVADRVITKVPFDTLDQVGLTDLVAEFVYTSTGTAYRAYAESLGVPVVTEPEIGADCLRSFIRHIDRLIADPKLRRELGNRGHHVAKENTRTESMAERSEELYARLLAEAGLPVPEKSLPVEADGSTDSAHLRIVFVTQEDPFYIPLFFREFFRIGKVRQTLFKNANGETVNSAEFPATRGSVSVLGLMIQRPLGNKTSKGLAKRIWRLYGSFGFLRVGFRYALAKVAGKLFKKRTVRGNAELAGVPVLSTGDANGEEFQEFVRREKIDLVVSVSASQIFRAEILSAPAYGCINLHNAPLPHFRGMLPNFWQMYEGMKQSVLTIHQMVEDLDKGDILLQRETEIESGMSLEDLMRKTKKNSARALWHVLDRFTANAIEITPLPEEEGSYYTWPTREQSKEFVRRGNRLL